MLNIIATRKTSSSQEVMDLDQTFLEEVDRPLLHLYSWPKPTISYGCLVNPEDFLDLTRCGQLGLTLAKRPTGGGIIFHLSDLAFSFLLPSHHPAFSHNTIDNYIFVNGLVAKALEKKFALNLSFLTEEAKSSRFCMATPTRYDIMIEGGKLVGAAQRRTKRGLLHQGSISLSPPPFEIVKQVLSPAIYEDMLINSRFLFSETLSPEDLEKERDRLEKSLIETFTPLLYKEEKESL